MSVLRVGGFIAILFLVVLLAACNRSQPAAASAAAKNESTEKAEAAEKAPPGQVNIESEIAEQSGLKTAPAGPGAIRDEHIIQGLLVPMESRFARVVARFPGPVRAVHAGLGESVKQGQILAVINSNVSLSDYPVTAPIAGTVLARNVTVGDLAGDAPLFEIADLSRLWVDLHLFGGDAQHIRSGLPVTVTRLSDGAQAVTALDRILPGTATASQSTVARATVRNTDGNWRPGSAVRALVSVSEATVPLIVPLSAVQPYRGHDVVFVQKGENYEARPVKLGSRDSRSAEVLEGIKSGEVIVIAQSFLIKADLEKSSVEDND